MIADLSAHTIPLRSIRLSEEDPTDVIRQGSDFIFLYILFLSDSDNCLESRYCEVSVSCNTITQPTTTGPAKGHLPASSIYICIVF